MIKNILEYFEQTILTKKDKVAVVDGQQQITFGGLTERAWAIGTYFLKGQIGIKHPIGVFLPKSIASIEADIGIIYSGNAYMNLDVKTPVARIDNIIKSVQPVAIITDKAGQEKLVKFYDIGRIFLIDDLVKTTFDHQALLENLERVIDTDPLCLINTSGSTGTPKSVVLNHKSFIDFTEWALATMQWTDGERFGSLSPAVFDIFSFELCMLMAKSATMVLVNPMFAAFPAKIVQLLKQEKITYIFWVPTIMVNIANMGLLSKVDLPDLKMVWFAGEVFPTKQFNIWRKALPKTTFVNMYGPIEITLDCTYFIANRNIADDEPIPIGIPCRNTDILVLDGDDKLVAGEGNEGELCVRGTSLAMGYYNNPEKTAAAFVQNPLNKSYPELIYRTGDIVKYNEFGEMVFVGRKDSLIKHSGYRIELSEIEHVIVNTLQLVKNGCAVYDYGKKEIVFFYEAESEITVADLRKQIGTALPAYMIPTRYVYQQLLPRNTNGKIDRLKLKESINNVSKGN